MRHLYILLLALFIGGCAGADQVYFAQLQVVGDQQPDPSMVEAKSPRLFSEDALAETLTVDFACSFDVVELTALPGNGSLKWASRDDDGNELVVMTNPTNLGKSEFDDRVGQQVCVKFLPEAFESDAIDIESAEAYSDMELCGTVQAVDKEAFVLTQPCPSQ